MHVALRVQQRDAAVDTAVSRDAHAAALLFASLVQSDAATDLHTTAIDVCGAAFTQQPIAANSNVTWFWFARRCTVAGLLDRGLVAQWRAVQSQQQYLASTASLRRVRHTHNCTVR